MSSALNQAWIKLLFIAVFAFVSNDGSALRQFCSGDFSPCTCSDDNGVVNVDCKGLDGAEIRSIFSRPTSITHLNRLFVELPPDCGSFPADMLSGKSVAWIEVYGVNPCDLTIDPNAFSSTSNRTQEVWLLSLNLRLFDFAFLREFSALKKLNLAYCSDIQALANLPSLPSVSSFTIDHFSGSANLTDFPIGRSFSQLIETNWIGGDLTDSAAEIIFGAIAQSPSVSTLKNVNLISNELTRMPSAMSLFESLDFLGLSYNNIDVLETGSLLFHIKPPQTFHLGSNPLTVIEPSAFIGDFSKMNVLSLSDTSMTRLPADVFLPVLEDMTHRGYGGVQLGFKSQFVCDCELAWLVRDHRHLLSRIASGYCTDGKAFNEVDPADYATC